MCGESPGFAFPLCKGEHRLLLVREASVLSLTGEGRGILPLGG